RHHLAGILEATLYLYIRKRSIPREINLASHERLNQGIVVRVEHPVELDAMPKKMRLESSEYTDVSRRRRSTNPHHNDLLLMLHTADPAHGRIKHLPTRTGWTGPSVCQFYSDSCAARPALEQRSQILDEPSGDRVSASFTAAGDRQFESISLQRRVHCEPDLAPWNRSPRPVPPVGSTPLLVPLVPTEGPASPEPLSSLK